MSAEGHGLDRGELIDIGRGIHAAVTFLNAYAGHMRTEQNTPAEDQAEAALTDVLRFLHHDPSLLGDTMCVLGALITELVPQEAAQEWFTRHAEMLNAELEEE